MVKQTNGSMDGFDGKNRQRNIRKPVCRFSPKPYVFWETMFFFVLMWVSWFNGVVFTEFNGEIHRKPWFFKVFTIKSRGFL